MPKLIIDGREITVEPGITILEAAGRLGIEIPTLCHFKGVQEEASCMICVVHEAGSGRLLPACAIRAAEGMEILTRSDEVQKARRTALQLLVNDHTGNCLAPCQKACPVHLNVPKMMRLLRQGKLAEAQHLIRNELIFPGVLGRVCPAYCERGCGAFRPDSARDPVGVRSLHHYLSESIAAPIPLEKKAASNLKIAIAGAGVTGLAVAFALLREGHVCHLFEEKAEPGGRLREEFPENVLPKEIVNREIQIIRDLGAAFFTGTRVGKDITLEQLRSDYGVVVLAWGKGDPGFLDESGLVFSEKGIRVEAGTYLTNLDGIFAGGAAVHSGQQVVRSITDGKGIAASVNQYLLRQPLASKPRRFQSHSPKPANRQTGFNEPQEALLSSREEYADHSSALQEAGRCLECDCSKAETCKLRQYATDYQPIQQVNKVEPGVGIFLVRYDSLIYDAGKCIKCEICVHITENANTRSVFSFMGRGCRTTLGIPINEPVDEAFRRIIPELEANCPTGALIKQKFEV